MSKAIDGLLDVILEKNAQIAALELELAALTPVEESEQ